MHFFFINVHLNYRGQGSSNRNASRDESVETGYESVETGDESIEAGVKTHQSCYNFIHRLEKYTTFHGKSFLLPHYQFPSVSCIKYQFQLHQKQCLYIALHSVHVGNPTFVVCRF